MNAGRRGTGRRRLRVDGVSAGYDRTNVIQDISIEVAPGRITCILGANGAGKSTLIRAILGLNRVRQGTVHFGEADITNLHTHQIANMGITTIPEGNRVLARMTVFENLVVGGIPQRNRNRAEEQMESIFASFPRLKERRNQLAGTLSGGERSMLSIARGLMADPELLILDEPSLGLSPLFVSEVFSMIGRLNQEGLSILLVEQNVRQTLNVSDHGYLLVQGRVVASGTTDALKNDQELHKAYFGVH